MVRRNGFTLVELLIVIAIMSILIVTMIGVINPITQTNKANDSVRKKDLNRMKTAFEEYYNDHGCYPSADVVTELNRASNCRNAIALFPYINPWVCDPVTNQPYPVVTDGLTCPRWYKIYANLQYKGDPVIPSGWYSQTIGIHLGDGSISPADVNYGVSSSNSNWSDVVMSSDCITNGTSCMTTNNGGCQSVTTGITCSGLGCYVRNNKTGAGCDPKCSVFSCVGP